jgi:hypothetical protein
MDSEEINEFVQAIYKVFVYMNLTDPVLNLSLLPFENRTFDYSSFDKKENYCIDGFAQETSPCIIILPPITRNNYPYNGIKQTVLIL